VPAGSAVRSGGLRHNRTVGPGEDQFSSPVPAVQGWDPSHDQLGDIFATLDATIFQRCFVAWVASITGVSADVIAIDGKTLRRSPDKRKRKAAIHMVSAFAARQRLVLGQVKVADKSNEIIAIPALFDMLAIEGVVVTIDAMGCQRDIAQKVIDKKADYILALKGNQGTLREDVESIGAMRTWRFCGAFRSSTTVFPASTGCAR
jgi:hypothetical protein